jgi:hypothetical protein
MKGVCRKGHHISMPSSAQTLCVAGLIFFLPTFSPRTLSGEAILAEFLPGIHQNRKPRLLIEEGDRGYSCVVTKALNTYDTGA